MPKPAVLTRGIQIPLLKPTVPNACHQQPITIEHLEAQVARDFDKLAQVMELLQQQYTRYV